MIIGIDASNIRKGGGLMHLVQLIRAIKPDINQIDKVYLWSTKDTLELIENKPWLIKVNDIWLNNNAVCRLLWRYLKLYKNANQVNCDVVYSPGGSTVKKNLPVIVMSQNLLPFEWSELKRFGFSFTTLKMMLLRFIQSRSFKNADGVIFLTNYAMKAVENVVGNIAAQKIIIPHGIAETFYIVPRDQKSIDEYSKSNPFKFIYVSSIAPYKNQCNVAKAVAKIRFMEIPITLDFYGPYFKSELKKLMELLNKLNRRFEYIRYKGEISNRDMPEIYKTYDASIFASSCENLPIILLESMASGLPIACSNKGPMPEVLGDSISILIELIVFQVRCLIWLNQKKREQIKLRHLFPGLSSSTGQNVQIKQLN